MQRPTFFLLSPANCSGLRAQMLMRPAATFDLACRLRSDGAPLADVFSFLSGLYFRGKIAYARHFARPPLGEAGIFVITAGRGLLEADTIVGAADLQKLAEVPIEVKDSRYRDPLQRTARRLAARIPDGSRVVLLGSIATNKYVEILAAELAATLHFPPDFVGRGDMSRGGLLLRCVRAQQELDYAPLLGAIRRGARPPKL